MLADLADGDRSVSVTGLGQYLEVETLEGTMTADLGDWIIRGVQGELYPCKPDIFAATYEPADAADPKADVIRDAQKILASYLPPDGISQHQAIGELLDLLDGPRARAALGDD